MSLVSGKTGGRSTLPSKLISEISRNSLLELVPGLTEVAIESGEVMAFGAQRVVCAQGKPADNLWIAIDGGLKIIHSIGASQGERLVGYLSRGRSIALKQVIHQSEYPYSVLTERPSRLLRIPSEKARPVLQANPDLLHYLLLMTSSSGARSLRTQLLEKNVHTDAVRAVLNCFPLEPEIVLPGQILLARENCGIYLVQSGELSVIEIDSSPNSGGTLTTLSDGAWFGGESLTAPFACSYRVRAETRSVVHFAKARELSRVTDRLAITEFFFSDPWIKSGAKSERSFRTEAPPDISASDFSEADRRWIQGKYMDLPAPGDVFLVTSGQESAYGAAINLARLMKREVNLPALERALKFAPRLTPLRIADVLEPFGYAIRVHQSSGNSLAKVDLSLKPYRAYLIYFVDRFLLFLGLNSSKDEALVLDSTQGYKKIPLSHFSENWDGQYLEIDRDVSPTVELENESSSDEPESEKKVRALRTYIIKMIFRQRRLLANTLGLTAMTLLLGLAPPYISEKLLDEVLTLRDASMLFACVTGLALTLVASIAASYLRQCNLNDFSRQIDSILSTFFYRHTLGLPNRHFKSQRAGELLTRMSELSQIRAFLAGNSIQGIVDLASVIIYAIVLAFYSTWITAIAAGLGALIVLLRLGSRKHFTRLHRQIFETESTTNSLISEQISSINAIKASGAEQISQRRWEKFMLLGGRVLRDISVRSSTFQSVVSVLSSVARLGAIWVAASFALKGDLTPGQIFAVSMYFDRLIGPLGNLAQLLSSLDEVKVSLKKVGEVLTAPLEQPPEKAASAHSHLLQGKIKTEALGFRYSPESPWVLQDLSFTIYPRQIIAIVGRSGCGKTTLAHLLGGTLKPTVGRIFYDDFDQNFLSQQSLRAQIGVIHQSSELFAGTLLDNIAFADDAPKVEDVERVANDSHSMGFIDALNSRFGHYLGEGGMGLSGGQKQRLVIARTLYRDPKILIMDEATSALDAESERAIAEKMTTILRGKTAIVIAHRLSTIRAADRILVMKEGRIVEDGTHAELLLANGHYSELFQSQVNSD